MINIKILVPAAATLVLLCSAPSRVCAQTNKEAFEQFQWTISGPGVTSHGMGGTFVASGDDASALLRNPAAIVMSQRRVAAEFRSTNQKFGRLSTVDSLFTGALTTSRERFNALSLIGASMPLRGNRMAIGFARHEYLDYRSSFHLPPRAVPGVTGLARGFSPVDSQIDFQAVSYATSIAAAFDDRLHVGATLSVDRLRVELLNTRHDVLVGTGPFDFSELSLISNQSRIDDDDIGLGLTIGALYRPVQSVSIGVAVSKRPSFTVTENYDQDLTPASAGSGRATDRQQGPLIPATGFPKQVSLDVPDQVTAGIQIRPNQRIITAVDVSYVRYSDLARALTPVVAHDVLKSGDFKINNAGELHAGGEVNVGPDRSPVWLRGGVFTVADHRLRFVGDVQPGGNLLPAQAQRINALERSRFNRGNNKTDVKGTVGAGVGIGRHVQADVAYVWKEQFVMSMSAGL